ncbi:MAG: riboflavin synthase [Dehalococcoidia bacterium]|nr:riboflavin synthase [Dehalococcoidia bacterium]
MFTGIIEELGKVIENSKGVLHISAPKILEDSGLGDSIAINGVDLTITTIENNAFTANIMPETYRRSALGELQGGDIVNLERSVQPNSRLSGHLVRGVTEGIGKIDSITPEQDALIVKISVEQTLLRYILVKGPVCIDGISLTVIAKDSESFSVSLVQYTQSQTTLAKQKHGTKVNIETDIIGRYVEQFLRESETGIDV